MTINRCLCRVTNPIYGKFMMMYTCAYIYIYVCTDNNNNNMCIYVRLYIWGHGWRFLDGSSCLFGPSFWSLQVSQSCIIWAATQSCLTETLDNMSKAIIHQPYLVVYTAHQNGKFGDGGFFRTLITLVWFFSHLCH